MESDIPLMIFVNSVSGGGIAGGVIPYAEEDKNCTIVKLPAEASTFHETHAELLRNPKLRFVAAGGDGTVNWVVSLLKNVYGFEESGNRPPIAVIPFGTGNDMSRSLGWGPGMDSSKLRETHEIFKRIRSTEDVKNVDIWNLNFKQHGGETFDRQMLNYFSVGVDAEVAKDFEDCRTGCCRCCFCCQCMSLTCYVPVGLRNLCCKRNLRDYVKASVFETEDENEQPKVLETRRGEKTLVIQAIPSMYAGRDAWLDHGPRSMDDHKFEIAIQGGIFKVGLLQIGCRTGRPVMQSTKTILDISEPFYYQVDGEGGMVNMPTQLTISRIGSYPMLFADK